MDALAQSDLVAALAKADRPPRMIAIYVINLARRPERRAWMESELARAHVEGVFVRAVDGRRFGACCDRPDKLGPKLTKAEAALILSHRKVWRKFLASGDAHAVVLEDDVHLGRDFRSIVDLDWNRRTFDAIKLETLFHEVWLTRQSEPANGRTLHRLGAEHLASAAYLVSRAGARKWLSGTRGLAEPVDHSLFGRRAIGEREIVAWQLVPAIAVQDNLHPDPAARRGLVSTLHEADRQRLAAQARRDKPRGWRRARREALRLFDQARRWIRLLPTMRRRSVPWE